MIKPVSSKVLRNTMLGLFALGSVSVAAANMSKNNSYVTEPNTELISKAGAEALKSNAVQVTTQSEVPTVHNQKLDATIRKFIEDSNDKISIDALTNNLYTNFGTFLGTAYMQHELNKRMLYTFMTGNTKLLRDGNIAPEFADRIDSYGEDFYKTVKPNAKEVLQWATGKYTTYFINKLSFNNKPTAVEVSDKLDDIIRSESILTDDEKHKILVMSQNYEGLVLKNKKDTQSMSNLIAYKVNMYDTYMFWHELRAAGVNSGESYRRSNKTIENFYLEWMSNIKPTVYNKK